MAIRQCQCPQLAEQGQRKCLSYLRSVSSYDDDISSVNSGGCNRAEAKLQSQLEINFFYFSTLMNLDRYANVSQADEKGLYPIHHACANNKILILQLLVEKQVDLQTPTVVARGAQKETPLHIAATRGMRLITALFWGRTYFRLRALANCLKLDQSGSQS